MLLCLMEYQKNQLLPDQRATQQLFQATVISRINYCNALLTGAMVCVCVCVVKPFQVIQAHLVFNQPKRAHSSLPLIELHWLPVDCKFTSLMLTYREPAGKAVSTGAEI